MRAFPSATLTNKPSHQNCAGPENSGQVISFAIESQMRCSHSIEIERQRRSPMRLSTTSPNCGYTYRSYYGFTLAHYGLIICPAELQKSPRENPCLHSFRVNSQLLWWDFHPLDGRRLRGTSTSQLKSVG